MESVKRHMSSHRAISLQTISLVCVSCIVMAKTVDSTSTISGTNFHHQDSVCRDDFLIIQPGRSTNFVLSTHAINNTKGVGVFDKKVTRHEMFRFELYGSSDEQWVIRTFDRSHLAVDSKGNLMVETGCVKTTFLRHVDAEHLNDCFNGVQCLMLLCATSTDPKTATFIVSPTNHATHQLNNGDCMSYKSFQAIQQSLTKPTFNITNYQFNFLTAGNHTDMISQGLKKLCPRPFDPSGQAQNDICPNK
ncbi:uncharacterized protein LOC134195698 [Corticium candelabrum]|uniref:uncharacterized protein LOC134195698 n=1 Tax=Corticium candelabrum TaxID=121492 RepID=UPI002E254773|nr:uncharacterized protein LOC134195698 [Corticium candelabrum]XP_062520754.1 uncharacterized protein LOC134195698 [Corticium candelabrum]XP_062520756.1 uncharacterized protein LOC134195698 [Corticium candelabrum]